MIRFRSRSEVTRMYRDFFSVDVGKILIRLQLRGRGAGTRAQNIDSQALVGKIFRTKELGARIGPGFDKARIGVDVWRIRGTIPL
jgi:hypothetical protein